MAKSRIIYTATVIVEGNYALKNLVKENGKIYKATVMTDLSDSMNYEQMQEFDTKAREAGDPRLISAPMFFQLAKQGMQNEDNGFLNFLNEDLKKWPNFFSAVNYSVSAKDKIIHYEGTSDEYFFEGDFVGEDNWISEIKDKKTLASLTGIKKIPFSNKISKRLNDSPAYLWRVNSKPVNEDDKRIVGLFAVSDWLGLGAGRDPLSRRPAFRVLLEEQ